MDKPSDGEAALFKKMLEANPAMREKIQAVLVTIPQLIELYETLPVEAELELWKLADEATRE